MRYITGTRKFNIDKPTAVTLGKFDGLHRGHQKLLNAMFQFRKQGFLAAVFTFETAPNTLMKGKLQTMITTNKERKTNLEKAGIDYLVEYPFNQEVSRMEPEVFIKEILAGQMGAKAIVVGTDFHFGYQRSGNVVLLQQLSEKYGYQVQVVEKAVDRGRVISSTYIREELAKGNIARANELLGYPYMLHGQVVHGKHLGKTLGFPTVNLVPSVQKHLPAFGVYLSRVIIDGVTHNSITNIGRKPTIDGVNPVGVETYIYGLNEDLYGKHIKVQLLDFVRPEQKFESVEQLKKQVWEDKESGIRFHESRVTADKM